MLTSVGDVMRRMYERGWLSTRDGNISLRRKNSKYLYITPSGVRKTIIHPEHIIKLRFENGFVSFPTNMVGKPSGELHMHYLLQQDPAHCRAVVHAHPTHIVAAMFAGWDLQYIAKQFPELNRYTKVGPTVPNLPATSKELGEATYLHFTTTVDPMGGIRTGVDIVHDIVGQANHGVTAIGPNPWTAYEHIERLNHVCEIVLASGMRPPR